MKQIIEIILVIAYNLTLLAGASYLFVVYNISAWIFAIPIIFAASWTKDKKTDSTSE